MDPRARSLRRQRRAFAVGLGLSVAIHALALALVHLDALPAPSAAERTAVSEEAEDRYLTQRPLRVVQLATATSTSQGPDARAGAAAAYTGTPAARQPARPDAVAAPRLTRPAGGLDLRPVEATSGGPEAVALASPVASGDGSSADPYEGLVFEAASRAAKEADGDRGRDRRGDRGSGIGITILGPGGGDCEPLLPGGGAPVPTGIIDDFAGGLGGGSSVGGRAGGRIGARPGSLVGGGIGRRGGGARPGGPGRPF